MYLSAKLESLLSIRKFDVVTLTSYSRPVSLSWRLTVPKAWHADLCLLPPLISDHSPLTRAFRCRWPSPDLGTSESASSLAAFYSKFQLTSHQRREDIPALGGPDVPTASQNWGAPRMFSCGAGKSVLSEKNSSFCPILWEARVPLLLLPRVILDSHCFCLPALRCQLAAPSTSAPSRGHWHEDK